MRTIHLLTLVFLAALVAAPRFALGAQGGRASVHAILVIASKQKGPSDPKLAPYEANLRSSLGRESFRYVGEGSASVTGGGSAKLSLPNGHDLDLTLEGGRVRVQFGRAVIQVPLGGTVVLAGRSAGGNGDVYATIVQAN